MNPLPAGVCTYWANWQSPVVPEPTPPAGSGFTCHESLNLTAWTGEAGTFVITGTATVNPAALTGPCLSFFPGSSPFTGVDTGFPAAPGHYNIGVGALAPGAVGEFNITVVKVP